jgi:copper chaperone CopZ
MKNIIPIISFLFIAFVAQAQTDAFSTRVEGLGCPFCAHGLEQKFKDIAGIQDIKIDIKTGIMTFSVPAKNNMPLDEVNVRVNKAGYTAMEMDVLRANGVKENAKGQKSPLADLSNMNITDSFNVFGKCDMCKTRIEAAAKSVEGVFQAEWNLETQMLTLRYDALKVKLKEVQKSIAKAGHDNGANKAKGKVYDALPMCCQYRQ